MAFRIPSSVIKILTISSLSVFLIFASQVVKQPQASAANITVYPGQVLSGSDGKCGLFEAIASSDMDIAIDACSAGSPGADTINLPNGTYDLSPGFINLVIGAHGDITISGESREGTIIDGGGSYGFDINYATGNSVTIKNLTQQNSGLGLSGMADANITLENTIWQDNTDSCSGSCSNHVGIKIRADTDGSNYGTLSISDTIIRNNHTQDNGTSGLYAELYENINLSNVEVYGNDKVGGLNSARYGLELRGTNVNLSRVSSHDNKSGGLSVDGNNVQINEANVYSNNGGLEINLWVGENPQARVTNSAVFNNSGTGGLSIANDNGGFSTEVNNVTISNNHTIYPALFLLAEEDDNSGHPNKFNNLTISDNVRSGETGGLEIPAGFAAISQTQEPLSIVMTNTILQNNLSDSATQNCGTDAAFSSPTSGGGNISSDDTCSFFTSQSTDQSSTDAKLGTLEQGGNTWVQPLLADSPAIDAGVTVAGISTDARLASRPQGSAFDSGAYEFASDNMPTPGAPRTGYSAAAVAALAALTLISISILTFVSARNHRPHNKHPHNQA